MVTKRRTRVLLVDDYRDVAEMWAFFLRSCGYDVVTSGNGARAIGIAAQQSPDLIVLDLDLPGLSGVDVARRLRDLPATARVPLIAATGFSHSPQLDEARRFGFEAVLVKPFDPTVLAREIESILKRSHRSLPA